jgi:hypothetical protein
MGADFRDYDNDGWPDIHVTALNNETFPLFRNTGKGEFIDATHSSRMAELSAKFSGWSNVLADLDNDGWKDIVTANSHVNDRIEAFEPSTYKQTNTVFLNRSGKFVMETFGPARVYRGGAVADLDGDGRLDIVTTALGDNASIWRNDTASTGHWLIVRTRTIGTTVKVAGQMNHMTTAAGYASSSHAGVHFGLGDRTKVEVEVRWPSGKVQTVKDVAANQILDVKEP